MRAPQPQGSSTTPLLQGSFRYLHAAHTVAMHYLGGARRSSRVTNQRQGAVPAETQDESRRKKGRGAGAGQGSRGRLEQPPEEPGGQASFSVLLEALETGYWDAGRQLRELTSAVAASAKEKQDLPESPEERGKPVSFLLLWL